ncbi:BrnT family toxin [Dolichospermum sp. LEGE 00240]|nr:BrnT family toxin [Dolichospermum sp. LEGE 00240]
MKLEFTWDSQKAESNIQKHGISVYYRLLVVCHCYRENDPIIRIISARKANKLEQKQYQEFL